MSPAQHVIASAATSLCFAFVSPSWQATLACFLSGIFIDLDHVLDFCINKKRILSKLDDLFAFCQREKKGKLYLVFHSYELMVVFWLGIFFYHLDAIWIGVAVGMTAHLALDQLFNPLRLGAYFLIYRIKYRFEKESIFNAATYQKLL